MSLAAKWRMPFSTPGAGMDVAFAESAISAESPDPSNFADSAHGFSSQAAPAGEVAGESLWPAPEYPMSVGSISWRYACLYAIVSVYGAGLTESAKGKLVLVCPAAMPPEAAQAARDGLAELAGYIGGRLPANNRS